MTQSQQTLAPSKQVNGYHKLVDQDKIDYALRTFRCLIADLCQQFNGGHPGGAMGMAAIGTALWKYVMEYSPTHPTYFNRDRFVLSNGHTCLFQYTFLHLVGYKNMTFEHLKSYHSTKPESLCPGHPEIEIDGIEVTTGPLGQGVANAVGLAMATKHLAAQYNRPGFPVVNNRTFCMVGDACLQEGIALEAFQLAGHWRLDNLVVLYDNNQITCDGSVDLCNTEDINAKMRACNWHVIDIEDGCYDVAGLVHALENTSPDKPTFVNVRTIIGVGSELQGNAKAHGAALGVADVANIKRKFGMDPEKHYVVSDEVYDFFREAVTRGEKLQRDWTKMLNDYGAEYPELYDSFKKRVDGQWSTDWREIIPCKDSLPTSPTASRKSAGLVCNPLAAELPQFMVGTADLSPSVNMIWKDKVDFQHPDLKTTCGINGSYSGRYIHYGIREHAMAGIANGLAAFNKGTILPVTSSFFMFYLYAAPAVRMGALQGLQQIHIATHDSIGTGEDGPTHQPIGLAAFYRALPNILYIRPCDSEEVAGAFVAALEATGTPTIISLSRQPLEQYPAHSSRDGVSKGAYIFSDASASAPADVTLIGVGSEMFLAVKTAALLKQRHNLCARIISFPCQRLFEKQPLAYRKQVLGTAPRVVIEAYSSTGWERYADAGFSMRSFGHSLPGADAYKYFGYDEEMIAPAVSEFVDEVKRDGMDGLRGFYRELNSVQRGHLEY